LNQVQFCIVANSTHIDLFTWTWDPLVIFISEVIGTLIGGWLIYRNLQHSGISLSQALVIQAYAMITSWIFGLFIWMAVGVV